MKYPKYYTVKEWKKFDRYAEREDGNDITFQEVLLQKYDVILTDYKTKKEKLFAVIDKFNAKNINAGITKFNKGMDQFSKVVGSSQPKTKKSKPWKMGISQKDYDSLFKSKKTKSVSFWDEDKKTRKRRNKRAKKSGNNVTLMGSKKIKFF